MVYDAPRAGYVDGVVLQKGAAERMVALHGRAADDLAPVASPPGLGDLGRGEDRVRALVDKVADVCGRLAAAHDSLAPLVVQATRPFHLVDAGVELAIFDIEDDLR